MIETFPHYRDISSWIRLFPMNLTSPRVWDIPSFMRYSLMNETWMRHEWDMPLWLRHFLMNETFPHETASRSAQSLSRRHCTRHSLMNQAWPHECDIPSWFRHFLMNKTFPHEWNIEWDISSTRRSLLNESPHGPPVMSHVVYPHMYLYIFYTSIYVCTCGIHIYMCVYACGMHIYMWWGIHIYVWVYI